MDTETREKAGNLCYELGHLLIRRGTMQAQMDVIREQIDEVLDALAPLLPGEVVINVGSGYTPQVVKVYPDKMGSACVTEISCAQPSQVDWRTPGAGAVAEAVVAFDIEVA